MQLRFTEKILVLGLCAAVSACSSTTMICRVITRSTDGGPKVQTRMVAIQSYSIGVKEKRAMRLNCPAANALGVD